MGLVAAWKWLHTPSSVTTSIYTGALNPKRLPYLVRELLPELQDMGFQPLGLRVETTASQMPYFSVSGDRPRHVEFEAADGRCFLTFPPKGNEDYYLLSAFDDGTVLITSYGLYGKHIQEDLLDYLECPQYPRLTVAALHEKHQERLQKHLAEGRRLSGRGAKARVDACKMLYRTPFMQRKGRIQRVFVVGLVVSLWVGVAAYTVMGHPPDVNVVLDIMTVGRWSR
jgi:hypothetical protein